MGVSIFLLGGGGILRIAYALMFQSAVRRSRLLDDKGSDQKDAASITEGAPVDVSLPAQLQVPASTYAAPGAGRWLETNELEPASVTDHTTKLLDKEK